MKKSLLFVTFLFSTIGLFAQCSDLFFSEYVEGYANNKALEIYNPTGAAINLSGYAIARFSNGSTTAAPPSSPSAAAIIQLPDEMLAANDVFVVVLDKQDVSLFDSQFDKPVWNGYNVIDTIYDDVTMEPVLDDDGNVLIGPTYNENGSALFGDIYDEKYDLQCKANVFLCPEYEANRTMYFNGNDAVALITGIEVAPDGSNIVDVIGVIGEDPENTIDEPAWVDADGFWVTRDRTLVRNADVVDGRNDPADIVFQAGGTFTGAEWTSYSKNSFQYLGVHNSACANGAGGDEFSCENGVVISVPEVNQIPFNMFPNPLRYGSLTIEAEEMMDRVEIYNLMGQLIQTEKVGFESDKVILDVNQVTPGMYLVKIAFANDHLYIQKLVVE